MLNKTYQAFFDVENEPPELSRLIDAGQRISMCISTKTDLFQLGMVLWALAREVDDPERMERPLPSLRGVVPDYFCEIVESCLSKRPQGRRSARDLLKMFPRQSSRRPRRYLGRSPGASRLSPHSTLLPHRSDREYIDPKLAIKHMYSSAAYPGAMNSILLRAG